MRVAVISDIHGNLTALEAVIADLEWRAPDLVIHGGDLALMGGQPAEVIDCLRGLGWPGIVGNTDELLWRPQERDHQESRAPKLRPLLKLLFEEYAPATRELLGRERLHGYEDCPMSTGKIDWPSYMLRRVTCGERQCLTPTTGNWPRPTGPCRRRGSSMDTSTGRTFVPSAR